MIFIMKKRIRFESMGRLLSPTLQTNLDYRWYRETKQVWKSFCQWHGLTLDGILGGLILWVVYTQIMSAKLSLGISPNSVRTRINSLELYQPTVRHQQVRSPSLVSLLERGADSLHDPKGVVCRVPNHDVQRGLLWSPPWGWHWGDPFGAATPQWNGRLEIETAQQHPRKRIL